MSVYVDRTFITFGRMKMCHMLADTSEELHNMADKLGLKRSWYQGFASTPHYDISMGKRKQAIELGAVEVDRRGLVELIQKWRMQ